VFANVRDEMRIARAEMFGPVISAIPFTDIDEVIEHGNKPGSASAVAYGQANGARRIGWRRGCARDRR
jgi:acyl-CoA reductase-like NAD-dependent aldehyde dehydrogenase